MNTNAINEVYLFLLKERFENENILETIHNLNENEVITYNKSELLHFLNEYVKTVLYNCGMDEYILKAKSFNSNMYKELMKKYNESFNNGEYNLNNVKENAFNYIADVFLKYNIFIGKMENKYIDNITSIDSDIYLSIAKLIQGINLDKYNFLKEFIEYLEIKKDINIKMLK